MKNKIVMMFVLGLLFQLYDVFGALLTSENIDFILTNVSSTNYKEIWRGAYQQCLKAGREDLIKKITSYRPTSPLTGNNPWQDVDIQKQENFLQELATPVTPEVQEQLNQDTQKFEKFIRDKIRQDTKNALLDLLKPQMRDYLHEAPEQYKERLIKITQAIKNHCRAQGLRLDQTGSELAEIMSANQTLSDQMNTFLQQSDYQLNDDRVGDGNNSTLVKGKMYTNIKCVSAASYYLTANDSEKSVLQALFMQSKVVEENESLGKSLGEKIYEGIIHKDSLQNIFYKDEYTSTQIDFLNILQNQDAFFSTEQIEQIGQKAESNKILNALIKIGSFLRLVKKNDFKNQKSEELLMQEGRNAREALDAANVSEENKILLDVAMMKGINKKNPTFSKSIRTSTKSVSFLKRLMKMFTENPTKFIEKTMNDKSKTLSKRLQDLASKPSLLNSLEFFEKEDIIRGNATMSLYLEAATIIAETRMLQKYQNRKGDTSEVSQATGKLSKAQTRIANILYSFPDLLGSEKQPFTKILQESANKLEWLSKNERAGGAVRALQTTIHNIQNGTSSDSDSDGLSFTNNSDSTQDALDTYSQEFYSQKHLNSPTETGSESAKPNDTQDHQIPRHNSPENDTSDKHFEHRNSSPDQEHPPVDQDRQLYDRGPAR